MTVINLMSVGPKFPNKKREHTRVKFCLALCQSGFFWNFLQRFSSKAQCYSQQHANMNLDKKFFPRKEGSYKEVFKPSKLVQKLKVSGFRTKFRSQILITHRAT